MFVDRDLSQLSESERAETIKKLEVKALKQFFVVTAVEWVVIIGVAYITKKALEPFTDPYFR